MGIVPCYCNRHTIRSHTIRYICTNIFQIEWKRILLYIFYFCLSYLPCIPANRRSWAMPRRSSVSGNTMRQPPFIVRFTRKHPRRKGICAAISLTVWPNVTGWSIIRRKRLAPIWTPSAMITRIAPSTYAWDRCYRRPDVIRRRSRTTISIWRTILAIY